jgi:hypothetical protein
MEELKFPVGRFTAPVVFTKTTLDNYISVIEQFPKKLKKEVEALTQEQLDTPYRPGGWTVRQVVNHCADSHMNALIRVKLALTENTPVITAYMQDLWSELADSKHMPIQPALLTLEGLHARWVIVLKSLGETEWEKTFIHPEKGRALNLEEATASYAWHCEHHLAHITELKKRMFWK